MFQAELCGFLPPDFAGDAAPLMDLSRPLSPEYSRKRAVEVRNARRLQGGASTEADFFAEHGFVLLSHVTAVRDWDRDIGRIYLPEIEAIIRQRLLPGRRIRVMQAPKVTRRGDGGRHYAQGVHSDGPLTADFYARNVGAFASEHSERLWRQAYARPEVRGLISIDFWRTTNMQGPLRHMPLALCEPNSVERGDIFPTTMPIGPGGRATDHLALRFNRGQRWYYYPEVTSSEVIAFKLCEFRKDDPGATPQNVFHTAFNDPSTPSDAEERQSCEHRVGVMILRD